MTSTCDYRKPNQERETINFSPLSTAACLVIGLVSQKLLITGFISSTIPTLFADVTTYKSNTDRPSILLDVGAIIQFIFRCHLDLQVNQAAVA